MGATGNSAGRPHSLDEFFLVLPRVFPGQFNLYVQCFAVRNTVSENIAFAVLADIYDCTVFRIELAYRVVSGHASVLTQGGYDFVLENSLTVQ